MGELHLDEDMKISLQNNEDSNIIFLKNGELAQRLVMLVKMIPLEYGFSGVVGLKYNAVKDYVKWYSKNGKKNQKEYVPILINLGQYYASEINKK